MTAGDTHMTAGDTHMTWLQVLPGLVQCHPADCHSHQEECTVGQHHVGQRGGGRQEELGELGHMEADAQPGGTAAHTLNSPQPGR